MSKVLSEYDVENLFIERLESIGYTFVKLDNYKDVISNFREQLAKFNAKKLKILTAHVSIYCRQSAFFV